MILQPHINYHKWTKKRYQNLEGSLRDHLHVSSIQFYMPLFSLYFYIHNTPKANKRIDLERKYYLERWISTTKERYYNSNIIGDALIYDSIKHISEIKRVFCKGISILDPMHCIQNNYNLNNHHQYHLPSGYNYNSFQKINSIDNSAYIDTFCSFLMGQLVSDKISPSFPLFYGSVNCLGSYKYDITEEYPDLRMDKCFHQNMGKQFKLEIYGSDSDSEEDDRDDLDDSDDSDIEDIVRDDISDDVLSESSSVSDRNDEFSESSDDQERIDDCIAVLPKVPLQYLFIEALDGTLEDYLNDKSYSDEVLLSCLFQVSFALSMLQRRFNFTHNDLHINNVMFSETEKTYIYYKINNLYYKVPTHGKIFKIIDFGRAIFDFKGKTYMNDVFCRNGEAGGQYSYPHQVNFLNKPKKEGDHKPNPHFDMCRLSMTILEELPDKSSQETRKFLKSLCRNREGDDFSEMVDDFNLYIAIGQTANNSLPREIIMDPIFKQYRISKKIFPRKSYYTL